MAKGGGKRQKKDTQYPKSRKQDEYFSAEEDLDDEIDAFHKQRDIIPLDVDGDVGLSDEDDEHPVLDLEGFDDEEDEDNNDDDEEDDTKLTGFAAKIARQQKFLRQKSGGVDDEMDDDAEEEDNKFTWGGKKGHYHGADNVDYEVQSSDDDFPAEEEAEVLRLQREKAKSRSKRDFGIEDSDQDESGSDRELTLEEGLAKTKGRSKPLEDKEVEDETGTAYEVVKKDLNALSKEEQMDVVYSSAPELVGLISELNDALYQLESKVNPLLSKVKEIKDTAKDGVRYLETKQLLLLAYCQAISCYLLLKSEGHPVRDHPVLAHLLEIKDLLDKMKQIDDSLPSEIEEMLDQDRGTESGTKMIKEVRLSSEPGRTIKEPLSISNMTLDAPLTCETVESKVGPSEDHLKKGEKRKRQNDQVGVQSMEMLRLRASLEEKLKKKGTLSSVSNKHDKIEKHHLQALNRKLETLDDFADEVIEKEGGTNGHASSFVAGKLSKLVRTKLNNPKVVSGDDDLPKRDDIGERRRKHELRVLTNAGVKSSEEIGDEVDLTGIGMESVDADLEDTEPEESEDEFYKQVKQQRAAKLSAKADPRQPAGQSSAEKDVVGGKRHITYQMEKNRGLTRSRKKLTKNPRKKYKLNYEKKMKNRGGQVRAVKSPTSGSYGGETTGINAEISRSRRLH